MYVLARVFAGNDTTPEPDRLVAHFALSAVQATAATQQDDQGWFQCRLAAADRVYVIDRFMRSEEGIVSELQAWASWVESHDPNNGLIHRLATCPQVMVVSCDAAGTDDAKAGARRIARWLARTTAGVYQLEGEGIFSPEDQLLMGEEAN